jgi:hypothetical protein
MDWESVLKCDLSLLCDQRTRLVPPITPHSPNAWRECQCCGQLWVVADDQVKGK